MPKASKLHSKGLLIAALLILTATYIFYGRFSSKTLSDLEPEIIKKIEAGEAEDNTSKILANISEDDSAIQPWAKLMLGKLQESLSQNELAVAHYQAVSQNSAASLEARISILELDSSLRNGERINELRSSLEKLNRDALLKKLDLITARILTEKKDYSRALNLYQELRAQKTNPRVAKDARREFKSLVKKKEVKKITQTPAFKLNEIETLIKENNYKLALEKIEVLKTELPSKGQTYFDLLFKQESVLRKEAKHSEADELLLLISADGSIGSADNAILKIAKNAWNIDDNERALMFLEKLSERFPSSPLIDEAKYIEARIYEEEKPEQAIKLYQSITSSSSEWSAKAIKRLAWIFILQNNFEQANIQLGELAKTDDLRDHALYFKSIVKNKLSLDANEELKTLQTEFPSSYYNKNFSLTSNDNKTNCSVEIPDWLKERLSRLSQLGLRHYAGYEIDYYFLVLQDEISSSKLEYNRAQYQKEYGFIQIATKEGLKALRKRDLTSECRAELLSLAYPLVFKDEFLKAESTSSVDAALLLAIAHTESHFNPIALSHKNAVGLMQILPSTAKQLGLKESEHLSDIATNVSLGSKYLSQLTSRFNNNEVYAIAAYNAGPTAVERWMAKYPELDEEMWIEMISYPETNDYVKKVLKAKRIYQELLKNS